MIRPARPAAGAAVLLLAAGCAVVLQPSAPVPESAEAVVQRLAAAEVAVRSVRAMANVRYEGRGGAGSANQVVVVVLPDHARLETLTPFGTAALILTIRGEEFRVYAPARHEYGVGKATREAVERLARVPVPPEALLRLLVGLPPLPVRSGDPRSRAAVEANGVRVESVDGPFWQRVWTGPDGAAIQHGELGDAGGPFVQFEFGGRRALEGVAFPFTVRLDGRPNGVQVTLQYETVRLNEPVDPALFDLPRPEDGRTRILDLDAGPRP